MGVINLDLNQVLLGLSINLTSSAIVEFVKDLLRSNPDIDQDELRQRLATFINIQGADIKAKKVINFLAKSGFIVIEGSKVYSGEAILMYAGQGTRLTFGSNSISETPNTKIEAGSGAYIQAQGGAGIKQNEDGGISIFTGEDKS